MATPRRMERISLARLIQRIDSQESGKPAEDTVPTGFPSIDLVLGGGMRQRDLIVLGGDVGSGKSALALGIALRSASADVPVVFFSGEMDEDRIFGHRRPDPSRSDSQIRHLGGNPIGGCGRGSEAAGSAALHPTSRGTPVRRRAGLGVATQSPAHRRRLPPTPTSPIG